MRWPSACAATRARSCTRRATGRRSCAAQGLPAADAPAIGTRFQLALSPAQIDAFPAGRVHQDDPPGARPLRHVRRRHRRELGLRQGVGADGHELRPGRPLGADRAGGARAVLGAGPPLRDLAARQRRLDALSAGHRPVRDPSAPASGAAAPRPRPDRLAGGRRRGGPAGRLRRGGGVRRRAAQRGLPEGRRRRPRGRPPARGGHRAALRGDPAAAGARGVPPRAPPPRRGAAPTSCTPTSGYADLLGGPAARSLGLPTVRDGALPRGPSAPRDRVKAPPDDRRPATPARRASSRSRRARAPPASRRAPRPGASWSSTTASSAAPSRRAGARVRAELGLGADDLVVAMVSSLRPEKGHDVALEALRASLPRFRSLRLVVVGDGPLRPWLERAAAALGDRVVLAGYRPDVLAVLDAADVLLQPSRADALPTAVLEAMAASVPVRRHGRRRGGGELVRDGCHRGRSSRRRRRRRRSPPPWPRCWHEPALRRRTRGRGPGALRGGVHRGALGRAAAAGLRRGARTPRRR